MSFSYGVRPIGAVADGSIVHSTISKRIDPSHRRFFPDWDPKFALDSRSPITYMFGRTINEPGIQQRWQQSEAHYLSVSRMDRFWSGVIRDAVVEPTSLTVLKDGDVVRDTVRSTASFRNIFGDVTDSQAEAVLRTSNARLESSLEIAPASSVDEGYLLGFGVFANYFNWTLRFASRLRSFECMPDTAKLLVPAGAHRYIQSSLSFFNIPDEKIVYVSKPVHVGKLHVHSPIAKGRYEISPQIIANLQRNPIVDCAAAGGAGQILYAPRRGVPFRRVTNEEAVIRSLIEMGVSVFDNAKFSVSEQVAAFRSARFVIAAHGAGLSNIVYCKPGATIIEIIPEGYEHGATSYRSLSDMFGHRYLPLFAKEMEVNRKGNRANSDIEIDVAELRFVLRSLIRDYGARVGE